MLRLKEFLETYRENYQKKVHAVLLAMLVLLWVARTLGLGAILGLNVSIAITFAALALILFDIAQNTYPQGRVRFFDDQEEMYTHLLEKIRKKRISEALFIQYSASKADSLISEVLKSGAQAQLYLQEPAAAVSEYQKNRIMGVIDAYGESLPDDQRKNLSVSFYKFPASFRMVLINQEILAVGWYNYHTNPIGADGNASISVRGHDTPGILCYSGSQEFNVFMKEVNVVNGKLNADSRKLGNSDLTKP